MSLARTRAEQELARIDAEYAGKNTDYARRVRDAVLAARTLVAEVERDHEAADATYERTVERLRAEIAQLRAGTTLDQRIAVLEDDELLVRADFDRPRLGWELHHLEAMALRLRMAGAEDRTKLDLSSAKVSANVPNQGIINLDVDADRRLREWERAADTSKPPAMPPGDDPRAGLPLEIEPRVGLDRFNGRQLTGVAIASVLAVLGLGLLGQAVPWPW